LHSCLVRCIYSVAKVFTTPSPRLGIWLTFLKKSLAATASQARHGDRSAALPPAVWWPHRSRTRVRHSGSLRLRAISCEEHCAIGEMISKTAWELCRFIISFLLHFITSPKWNLRTRTFKLYWKSSKVLSWLHSWIKHSSLLYSVLNNIFVHIP
jgi:hypothetical protein